MRKLLLIFAILPSLAYAQPTPYSPAKMGITPQTDPQTVAVQDKNSVWVSMGTTTGGVFSPVGTSGGGGGSNICTCTPDGGQSIASVASVTTLTVPSDATYATVYVTNAPIAYSYSTTDVPTTTGIYSQVQINGFIGLIGQASMTGFHMLSLGTGGIVSAARVEYFK